MKIKFFTALVLFAFSCLTVRAAAPMDAEQFQKLMKQVGRAAKEFKSNYETKNTAAIEREAAGVAEAYQQMAVFWKMRKSGEDAVKWSESSAVAANATVAAVKAGDWEKVKSNWDGVGKNCKACHDKHREKLEDGSYKIK